MSKKNREGRPEAPEGPDETRWGDYFWIWLLFTAFISVLCYAVFVTCQAPGDDQIPALGLILRETLEFFFALMVGGFSVVLLFDAAYEFFAAKAEQPSSSPQEPPKA